MDALFWRGKWEEVPEDKYLRDHSEILKSNGRWVIDGWINPKMKERLTQADLIIYLDYPGWLCALRYIQRSWMHRKVARPELPEESLDHFKFRRFFLLLFRGERPELEAALASADPSKVVRFTSPKELEAYLKTASF